MSDLKLFLRNVIEGIEEAEAEKEFADYLLGLLFSAIVANGGELKTNEETQGLVKMFREKKISLSNRGGVLRIEKAEPTK